MIKAVGEALLMPNAIIHYFFLSSICFLICPDALYIEMHKPKIVKHIIRIITKNGNINFNKSKNETPFIPSNIIFSFLL